MKDTILLTFGCSWTFGEGSGYEDWMNEEQYEKIRENEEICYKNGWRKKVIEHFDIDHINFGQPGSSNDLQFRLAKHFFTSKKFQEIYKSYKNIIVLWGITSTNRYDFWCKDTNKYEKVLLNNVESDVRQFNQYKDQLGLALKKLTYNHRSRVNEVEVEIIFWNQYFKLLKIKNFWFDTFNSVRYNIKPANFFGIDKPKRDLLSVLCDKKSDQYKIKNIMKDNEFDYAKNKGIVNEYSLHPKKEGYSLIADYFIDKLKEHI